MLLIGKYFQVNLPAWQVRIGSWQGPLLSHPHSLQPWANCLTTVSFSLLLCEREYETIVKIKRDNQQSPQYSIWHIAPLNLSELLLSHAENQGGGRGGLIERKLRPLPNLNKGLNIHVPSRAIAGSSPERPSR